jgi:hypothetical protein
MKSQLNITNPIRHVRTLFAVALLALLSACATNSPTHHYFMQGQVLSVQDQNVELCVGTAHGAEVGQVLSVYRNEPVHAAPKSPRVGFKRVPMGQVRIVEVFDEHYARAEIVSGEVHANDTAELQN